MNKITGDITEMAAQVPALFEALSGMKMSDLLGKVRTIGDKSPQAGRVCRRAMTEGRRRRGWEVKTEPTLSQRRRPGWGLGEAKAWVMRMDMYSDNDSTDLVMNLGLAARCWESGSVITHREAAVLLELWEACSPPSCWLQFAASNSRAR